MGLCGDWEYSHHLPYRAYTVYNKPWGINFKGSCRLEKTGDPDVQANFITSAKNCQVAQSDYEDYVVGRKVSNCYSQVGASELFTWNGNCGIPHHCIRYQPG